MELESRYIIDPARVVGETLEGETMLINMENGNYYSLNKTASALWALIEAGRTQGEMRAAFLSRYEGDADMIASEIAKTTELFLNDRLVVESNQPLPAASEETPLTKIPFEPLVVERHEDMQEMLLADPIHDVDASGWPTLKV